MGLMDDALNLLADTVHANSAMVLTVAVGALVVALALSFISRFAFYILGGLGTVGAGYTLVTKGLDGLTLAGILLIGGWVAGFVVRGMIKFGSIIVTAFAVGLVWLDRWANARVTSTELWPWWYFAVGAVLLVGLVLAMPTILAKVTKGAVKAVVPGGGDKKEKPAPKPPQKPA